MYLIIIFNDERKESDLTIIKEPTAQRPGQAKIKHAKIGARDPNAKNALPVLSQTSGAKFGVLTKEENIFPPYSNTYKII